MDFHPFFGLQNYSFSLENRNFQTFFLNIRHKLNDINNLVKKRKNIGVVTIYLNYYSYLCIRKTGKSCTASSLRILQDGNVAKVVGCSGAM